MTCECTGCCDTAFEDFPEQIYVRFQWDSLGASLDIHTTMYRRLNVAYSACQCKKCTAQIVYESRPIKFALIDPGISRICCAAVSLIGECVDNPDDPGGTDTTCVWKYGVTTLTTCPALTDITLTCLVEGSGNFLINRDPMEECLDPDARVVDRRVDITFSETSPGGSEADECDKLCCPDLPETLYLTLESDCVDLDGIVVPITRNQMDCEYDEFSAFNNGGTNQLTWSGAMDICSDGCANRYTFSATTNTYSTDPQCRWRVRIGKESNNCFDETLSENDTEYCLPVLFTLGEWTGDVGDPATDFCFEECCADPSGFQLTVTLSE